MAGEYVSGENIEPSQNASGSEGVPVDDGEGVVEIEADDCKKYDLKFDFFAHDAENACAAGARYASLFDKQG